jgi:Holliday junction resolvase
MPGKHSRNKGARFEREVVNLLKSRGHKAERIPFSGAMGSFKGDVQVVGKHKLLRMECKWQASGFKFVYQELGDNDALLLRADGQEPLIVFRLSQWADGWIDLDDLHHS